MKIFHNILTLSAIAACISSAKVSKRQFGTTQLPQNGNTNFNNLPQGTNQGLGQPSNQFPQGNMGQQFSQFPLGNQGQGQSFNQFPQGGNVGQFSQHQGIQVQPTSQLPQGGMNFGQFAQNPNGQFVQNPNGQFSNPGFVNMQGGQFGFRPMLNTGVFLRPF